MRVRHFFFFCTKNWHQRAALYLDASLSRQGAKKHGIALHAPR